VGVHDQFADQAAAYALGALTAAERADFEAHLAICAACAAEVRSFAVVTGGLALAVSPAIPASIVRAALVPSGSVPAERSVPLERSVPDARMGWASTLAVAASMLLA
jgi:anti-sigma factor RsiW